MRGNNHRRTGDEGLRPDNVLYNEVVLKIELDMVLKDLVAMDSEQTRN